MNGGESKTHDLQIFLGRIPGDLPTHYEGIPSLVVAEGPIGTTRDLGASASTVKIDQHDLPMYILVANSDVVGRPISSPPRRNPADDTKTYE
jgi:hypothetical protein